MHYLATLLPLAALAVANPLERRGCNNDACLAAVTGKAALGDDNLRKSHCASFLATTVTPPAVTVTATVTGDQGWGDWKRGIDVTVCPNEVPNYASACDEKAYSSACACYGFSGAKTTTLAPTTTTKTVYVAKPTGGSCASGTATVYVTVTKGGNGGNGGNGGHGATATVTVTEHNGNGGIGGPTGLPTPGKGCLTDADAKKLTDNFILLLENTNYNGTQGPPGKGYPQAVSDATLDKDFADIADSINFMAGIPLGSVTFPNKAAFDAGQGSQSELRVSTLNIWKGCRDITWRYRIEPPTPNGFPVVGINHIDVNDKGLMIKNYAEFNSAAWLQSYGQQCALVPPTALPTSAAK